MAINKSREMKGRIYHSKDMVEELWSSTSQQQKEKELQIYKQSKKHSSKAIRKAK